MSTTRSHLMRRALSVLAAGALSAATLSVAAPAHAADVPGEATGSGATYVSDATFAWGLNGYAQKGIFGPWTFKDLTGNVTLLDGRTAAPGGAQTEYVVNPIPATSFPTTPGTGLSTANAVKFTDGTGVIDKSTGAGKLSWTGKYVVNAYPAIYNAPNETYEDPELTVDAAGVGTLTVDFSIGAGTDMNGNPFDAQDFGRLKLATFSAGSLSAKSDTGYRITPDYEGVSNGISNQDKSCTTAGGATGWWGSWPQEFINALNSHASGQSVLAHFYSTGCAGNQDLKKALPLDVKFHTADAPHVTVSNTAFGLDGTSTVTVTGENFHPNAAKGARPPFNGQSSGVYVAFGKFAENWRPSLSAPAANRKTRPATTGSTKWAVIAANLPAIGGTAGGGVELSPDGDFTAEVTIDKAALDELAGAGTEAFRYGIYTYPGSGGIAGAYETYIPLTFSKAAGTIQATGPSTLGYGSGANYVATVSGNSGTVTVSGVGTAQTFDVVDNKVTYALPKTTTAGNRTLTFAYSGDATTEGATTTKSFTVKPRSTRVAATWTTKPTSSKAGKLKVKVTPVTAGVKPAGTVTVKLTKSGKSTTRPAKTLSADSVAAVDIPKLAKGTWTVRATYTPTKNFVGNYSQITITVK